MTTAEDGDFTANTGHALFLETNLILVCWVVWCWNTYDLQNFGNSANRAFIDGFESSKTNFVNATEVGKNWSEVGGRELGRLHGRSKFASEGALLEGG